MQEEAEVPLKNMSTPMGAHEPEDATKFSNSLQELKDLSSQLRHAADYCESSFLNGKNKNKVIENTKEYVCRAVVTVVDHLGNVSANNLDYQLSITNLLSQTQHRIQSLQQKLLTYEDYAQKLALSKLRWKPLIPRYHLRYLSPPATLQRKQDQSLRESRSESDGKRGLNKNEFVIDEEVPLFLYTYNYKPTLIQDSSKINTNLQKNEFSSPPVLPVSDSLCVVRKPQTSTFQFQETRKAKRNMFIWKSVHSTDILSLARRRK